MALENLVGSSIFISSLVASNPPDSDDPLEGAAHIRGIKNAVKNSFPNINGAVSATDEQLNQLGTGDLAVSVKLTLPQAIGSNWFVPGTGDGADFSTYNVLQKLHYGMAICAYDDIVRLIINARTGDINLKGGFYRDGVRVDSIGTNQTWQNVTASRANATTYTNNTGRPLGISVLATTSSGTPASLTISGLVVANFLHSNVLSGHTDVTLSGIVPVGATYSVTANAGISSWLELF